MDVVFLREEDLIDTESEAHYAYIGSMNNTTGIHYHDFFEIFLITGGSVIHNVNGIRQRLPDGSLVFVRPDDIHFYERDGDNDCQLINLAFPAKTIDALFGYLGDGFLSGRFINSQASPAVFLSKGEKETARKRLEALFTIPHANKNEKRTALRALLVEFFFNYFPLNHDKKADSIPEWLESLNMEMRKKENFTQGLHTMQLLSGKTPEHLCRVFMKYYEKSPSQFINELRLGYAANLLAHTDESILTIAMDSGFENLSHFYHLFRKKYLISPANFRKSHQKVIIPL